MKQWRSDLSLFLLVLVVMVPWLILAVVIGFDWEPW